MVEINAADLIKRIPLVFEGADYEFVVLVTALGYEVHVVKNNKPHYPTYHIDFETSQNLEHQLGERGYESLVNTAIIDVLNKTYEPK